MNITREQWFRLAPLIAMLVFVLLLSTGLFTKNRPNRHKTVPLVGYELPLFNLPFVGRPTSTHSFSPKIFKGNVILLNVFGSWCEPCAAEHPLLMDLARTGKVNMVGIAWKDKEDKVIGYLTEHGNPFQLVGLDELGQTTVPLGLTGVPETLIIDKRGFVVFDTKEPLTEEVINNTILPLIDKLDPGAADRAVQKAAAQQQAAPAAPPQQQPAAVAPAPAPTAAPAPAQR